MTEEQYNYHCRRVADANEYKQKIMQAERMLKNLEVGNRIDINVGNEGIQMYLSTEELVKIKLIIANHYQQELEEYKKKLEEL